MHQSLHATPGREPRPPHRPQPSPDAAAVLRLQRLAGNRSVARVLGGPSRRSPVLDVISSGRGRPLDPSLRTFMEQRLGHDLRTVRIHTGDAAAASARSVNADAYTAGENIVFQDHAFRPDTDAGKRILAHELAHVIQQRSGPVPGTPAPGGIRISDPSDAGEREAERAAAAALGPQARATTTRLVADAP